LTGNSANRRRRNLGLLLRLPRCPVKADETEDEAFLRHDRLIQGNWGGRRQKRTEDAA